MLWDVGGFTQTQILVLVLLLPMLRLLEAGDATCETTLLLIKMPLRQVLPPPLFAFAGH